MAANPQPPSPLKAFLCGGAAACIAEVVTLPIDTAKVRLQLLQRSIQGGGPVTGGDIPSVKLNMISMLRKIATEEGLPALYKGMVPALHRQIVFASLRIGLYKEISNFFKRPGEDVISLPRKILSGLVSGALGITVACPTDLVKVRMQSDRARPGQTPRYPGVLSAYAAIVREEGVKGLWTGLGPAVLRNSVINATELATYETTKEFLMSPSMGLKDGFITQVLAGANAGLFATLIGNPVDVIKTRVMADSKERATSGAPPQYKGAIDCVVKTFQKEGFMAFYQGVTPQFFRLTGWSVVMFVSFEQLKRIF